MQYVYMLRAGENHYKVGVAQNIKKRVAGIQTSNPNKVEVVTAKLVEDAYAVEGQLHTKLHELKTEGGTEWFVLSNKQAIELSITINELPDIDIQQNIKLRDILKRQEEVQWRIERKLNIVTDLAATELAKREAEMLEKASQKPEPKPPKISDEALLEQAKEVIALCGNASTSMLQRHLQIGYGRAARLIDKLEVGGIIGAADGSRPRKVLELERYVDKLLT